MNLKYSFIYLVVITEALFLFGCQNKEHTFNKETINDIYTAQTAKVLGTGNYNLILQNVDSVYAVRKKQTVWDKYNYYFTHCWISNRLLQYKTSLKYADSCIAAFKTYGINEETISEYATVLLEQAVVYLKVNEYNIAYERFFEARQAIAKLDNICSRINPLQYYGIVLYQQAEYRNALSAFAEEFGYIQNCNVKLLEFRYGLLQQTYGNIGLCYTKLNVYDSARNYFYKALSVIENNKNNPSRTSYENKVLYEACRGVVLGNLAKTYVAENNLDSAEILLKEAVSLNITKVYEKADAQLCLFQLAQVQIGKQEFASAEKTLSDLRKSLDSLPNEKAELGYRETLLNLYKGTRQPVKELEVFKNLIALKDSISKKQAVNNTTNINMELKDKEQQLQIQLLQKDKNIGNLYLGLVAGVLLLVAVTAFFIYKNFNKSKKQNQELIRLNDEIKEQQKETEYARQQLEVSNKDKDRILRVVAHDLRNPIGGIAAISQSLMDQEDDKPANKDLIKMIENTSNHSLALINELLQTHTGNTEKLNITATDVNAMLQQAVALLKHKAAEKLQQLELSLPYETIMLQIDAPKMERVVANLVTNAIKFSPKKSVIKITAEKKENSFLISVADKGIGISKENQEQIFEMFSTARRKGTEGEKSFGLGLSICKQIVEAHKGKIWVESEEGKGSSFAIQLPG